MSNIRDVAKLAGVSVVTVSRVVNSAPNVRDDTRQRVEQAIRDLAYVPNLAARSLRSRQTSTLALIVPDITNPFWTTVARGVEDAAQSAGYSVLLCNTDENPSKQTNYINAVLQQRVDGVIIAPYGSDAANLAALRDRAIPTVAIDRRVTGWDVDTVYSDTLSGSYSLTRHLISLGHRSIAIISGPLAATTAEDRLVGYCLALSEAGLPIDLRLIRHGEHKTRSGHLLMDDLLNESIPFSAVVASNNLMSIGVIESLQAHGRRIPDDVALVSFDELPDLTRFFPFITTVDQPAYDMGINAAQLLLSRLEADAPLQPRQVVLPARLVLRYSCGRFLHTPGIQSVSAPVVQDLTETVLVKALSASDQERLAAQAPDLPFAARRRNERNLTVEKSDVRRLLNALRCQNNDRPALIANRTARKDLLEYVLERSLTAPASVLQIGAGDLSPADVIEFAQRIGIDAVPCEFSWRPEMAAPQDERPKAPEIILGAQRNLTLLSEEESSDDIRRHSPPPPLAEQISALEALLRAGRGSGVGCYALFSGFVEPALQAAGIGDPHTAFQRNLRRVDGLMDVLVRHQERVLRAVTDRFAEDLAFIAIEDTWPGGLNLGSALVRQHILPRLVRLIAPAREHGLPIVLRSRSIPSGLLEVIHQAGFSAVWLNGAEDATLRRAIAELDGDMTLLSELFPGALTQAGQTQAKEALQEAYVRKLSARGAILVAPADSPGDTRPEIFVAMLRAVQRLDPAP
jgi:LacI family transcriptional regulator